MKKTPIIYISIILGSLVIGGLGGLAAKRLFGEKNYEIQGFSADSLSEDIPGLMARYNSYQGSNIVRDFTPAEMINIGLENYKSCENSYSMGIGSSNGIVLQTIRNFQIRNGNSYFEESISDSSFVHLAKRMVQEGKGGDVVVYNSGNITSPSTAVYTDNGVTYSNEGYKAYLGRTLDEMFIYIISNKTVLSGDVSTNEEGDYVIQISLETMFATYNYKTQMKNISDLDSYPNFDYVNLTFTLTKKMMLKRLHVNESFKATKMGMSPTMVNDITYYYYANEVMELPTLDQNLDYTVK